jgi:hypothetical protein
MINRIILHSAIPTTLIYLQRNGTIDNEIIQKLADFLDEERDTWAIAHFLLHLTIGLKVKDSNKAIIYSIAWSLIWEQIEGTLGEYWQDNGEDDYLINALGLASGLYLKIM